MGATVITSGTVKEGPGTIGTRIINNEYPFVEGLEAGTTIQSDD